MQSAQIILHGAAFSVLCFKMPESLKPLLNSLREYPSWFVALCLCLAGATAIYVLAKLIKFTLYALLILVLVGGLAVSIYLLIK